MERHFAEGGVDGRAGMVIKMGRRPVVQHMMLGHLFEAAACMGGCGVG